ncbi:hypothetical protein [[Clostridium] aminophilum]|uniref:Uncharacterized protein n=1 Tax=[Clostridium] aminophilum TaxID=1526 RepID=A0A1I6KFN1_9FIRM|nr:hypothetical protein [[Clostridium] aminophilum]SFR89848.1 hypothetical protein SAMN02910262_02508 [[Clostridium] aminophilum]
MKFENVIKTAVILTGVGVAVSGIFDIRKGRGCGDSKDSCCCGGHGEGVDGHDGDGCRFDEDDETIIEMEKECSCGSSCCRTAKGILKVLTGGIVIGLGVASAFLDFEEKIGQKNPELAERIARAEEWCQKLLDDGAAKSKVLAAQGRDLAVQGKDRAFAAWKKARETDCVGEFSD